LLTACGTTGASSRFAISLDSNQLLPVIVELRVGSAAIEVAGIQFTSVNARPWGKFVPEDLRNLQESLRETLAPFHPATTRNAAPSFDIHLVIRDYAVGVSNTAGAVLTCVTWTATNPQGKQIFEEQFYAAKAIYLIGTIGYLKDLVHRAIVRRIATRALTLVASPGAARTPSFDENTSTSLADATSCLSRILS
jgi:hypothetical protein